MNPHVRLYWKNKDDEFTFGDYKVKNFADIERLINSFEFENGHPVFAASYFPHYYRNISASQSVRVAIPLKIIVMPEGYCAVREKCIGFITKCTLYKFNFIYTFSQQYPSTWSDKTFKTSASQQFNLDPLEFDFCDLDEVSNVRLDYPFS